MDTAFAPERPIPRTLQAGDRLVLHSDNPSIFLFVIPTHRHVPLLSAFILNATVTASSRLMPCLLLLASSLPLRAEDKTAELRARLASAAAQSSLDAPGLVPWHLKLDVQLFDDKGSPTDKGIVETWWINPTDVRTTYTFPTYKATEVISPTGTRRTKGAGLPPDAVSAVFHQVIHPMPDQADMDQATPDLRKQTFSKVQSSASCSINLPSITPSRPWSRHSAFFQPSASIRVRRVFDFLTMSAPQ